MVLYSSIKFGRKLRGRHSVFNRQLTEVGQNLQFFFSLVFLSEHWQIGQDFPNDPPIVEMGPNVSFFNISCFIWSCFLLTFFADFSYLCGNDGNQTLVS